MVIAKVMLVKFQLPNQPVWAKPCGKTIGRFVFTKSRIVTFFRMLKAGWCIIDLITIHTYGYISLACYIVADGLLSTFCSLHVLPQSLAKSSLSVLPHIYILSCLATPNDECYSSVLFMSSSYRINTSAFLSLC